MISRVAASICVCPSVISTLPLPARRPLPLIQSILFFRNRSSMPPVRPLTILSLRACTWPMSRPMAAFADRQAPVLPVLGDLERVRVLEQRFGRDAAPVEAGAAEGRRALDDRGLETELRGADSGDVAAGAGADDHDVVRVLIAIATKPSAAYSAFFFIEDRGTNDTVAAGGWRRARRLLPVPDPAATPASAGGCSRSAVPSRTGSVNRVGATTGGRRTAPRPRRATTIRQRPRAPQPI